MNKIKQTERVYSYIQNNGYITIKDAVERLGIMSLPARICELEKDGIEIIKTKGTGKNRYGEKIHFTIYSLK